MYELFHNFKVEVICTNEQGDGRAFEKRQPGLSLIEKLYPNLSTKSTLLTSRWNYC